MKKVILDKYEREIQKALKRGDYVPVENQEESIMELQEAAKNYFKFKKNKSITLRVEGEDLTKVKVKAQKHGIPYQRIINMLINGYANNRIKLAI
ncbi:MAG: CopG family antitoxin [Candidatus Woesebacteria bacterium]|nr:CopG family antitoxin [Candidatus Woesebacteria bacterium]